MQQSNRVLYHHCVNYRDYCISKYADTLIQPTTIFLIIALSKLDSVNNELLKLNYQEYHRTGGQGV